MALTYSTLKVQLAQELRILQKRRALWRHIREASLSNSDRGLLVAANAYGTTVDEEARALADAYNKLTAQEDIAASLWADYLSHVESDIGFFGIIINDLDLIEDEDKGNPISYEYTDTDGVIAISERKGILGKLRRQMTTDTEYITANGVTFGTFTAANGNLGTLAATSMSGESHCMTGTLIFRVEEDTVDAPKMSVKLKFATPVLVDGVLTAEVEGDNLLTPGAQWEDGPTGLTTVLTISGLASPTEAGDGGAMFASSSLSALAEGDSNKGKIFIKVSREASDTWRIAWYRDSALTDLVQQVTTTTLIGTYAVDMTGANGMRFQSTFDRAAANTALPSVGNSDSDITFDPKPPRLGDEWTRTVTNDEAGIYSTKIAQNWRASLVTSGANLWTDSAASSISMS